VEIFEHQYEARALGCDHVGLRHTDRNTRGGVPVEVAFVSPNAEQVAEEARPKLSRGKLDEESRRKARGHFARLDAHDRVVAVAADRLDVRELDRGHLSARGGVCAVLPQQTVERVGRRHRSWQQGQRASKRLGNGVDAELVAVRDEPPQQAE
jgi:hypothetical protein